MLSGLSFCTGLNGVVRVGNDFTVAVNCGRPWTKGHNLGGYFYISFAGICFLQPVLHSRNAAGFLCLSHASGRMALLALKEDLVGIAGGNWAGADACHKRDFCDHVGCGGAGACAKSDLEQTAGWQRLACACTTTEFMACDSSNRHLARCSSGPVFLIFQEPKRTGRFAPNLWPVVESCGRRIRAYPFVEFLFSSVALVPCGEGPGLDGSVDSYSRIDWRSDLFFTQKPRSLERELWAIYCALHLDPDRRVYTDLL